MHLHTYNGRHLRVTNIIHQFPQVTAAKRALPRLATKRAIFRSTTFGAGVASSLPRHTRAGMPDTVKLLNANLLENFLLLNIISLLIIFHFQPCTVKFMSISNNLQRPSTIFWGFLFSNRIMIFVILRVELNVFHANK